MRIYFFDVFYSLLHSVAAEYCNNGNFVEASYLLSKHAELTELNDDSLPQIEYGFREMMKIPEELSWKRRIYLLEKAINLCEEACAWERCLVLIDVLIRDIRSLEWHRDLLKKYLQKQIELLDRLSYSTRLPSSFFMVSYHGGGFHEEFRNSVVVFHRPRGETITEFISIQQKKHPDVVFLKQNQNPDELSLDCDKYIKIVKVKQDNTFSLNRKNLNFSNSNEIDFKFQEIGSKLQSTDDSTNVFEYKICSRRNASISNEFLDLWVTKYFIVTDVALPSHVDKTNVVGVTAILLNPIEVALEEVGDRLSILGRGIKEMEKISNQESKFASQQTTMELSGTIDAAVNGGISKYYSFISYDYKWENPAIDIDIVESGKDINTILMKFKVAFQQLIDVAGKAVEMHKIKVSGEMKSLHDHLEGLYVNNIVPKNKEFMHDGINNV